MEAKDGTDCTLDYQSKSPDEVEILRILQEVEN